MNKRHIFNGILIGILANFVGFIIACWILKTQQKSPASLMEALGHSLEFISLAGKLISLGAFANLCCFFYFIKKQQDANAAGVLIATILVALINLILKF
jgi:hypothetical protein